MFGHSSSVIPLQCLLGLFKDSTLPILSDNYATQGDRTFRASRTDPMATNLAFVLYDCQPGIFLFCWTKVLFVVPLIAPNLAQWVSTLGGSLACNLSCLCAVNLRVMSGATAAVSTNRDVYCVKHAYSVFNIPHHQYRHHLCEQQRAGRGGLVSWATALPGKFALHGNVNHPL